ncbi:MAG: FkbM family methyltransferase [Gaiellaceae bacterium]
MVAGRLVSWLQPFELAIPDAGEFVVKAQTGSPFPGRTDEVLGLRFTIHGYFDWRCWAVAIAVTRPGDTIIEVGANIGTETVGFADIVGPSGRVMAFEPSETNLVRLRSALAISGHNNVLIRPVAVSDTDGVCEFYPPARHNSGLGFLALGKAGPVSGGWWQETAAVTVQCTTLDRLADEIGRASIIYADVEGAEVHVLRGARRYIAQYHPVLVLEVDSNLMRRAGSTYKALCDELLRQGYIAAELSRFGLTSIDLTNETPPRQPGGWARNWLCLPRERRDLRGPVQRALRMCGWLPFTSIHPFQRVARRRRLQVG